MERERYHPQIGVPSSLKKSLSVLIAAGVLFAMSGVLALKKSSPIADLPPAAPEKTPAEPTPDPIENSPELSPPAPTALSTLPPELRATVSQAVQNALPSEPSIGLNDIEFYDINPPKPELPEPKPAPKPKELTPEQKYALKMAEIVKQIRADNKEDDPAMQQAIETISKEFQFVDPDQD